MESAPRFPFFFIARRLPVQVSSFPCGFANPPQPPKLILTLINPCPLFGRRLLGTMSHALFGLEVRQQYVGNVHHAAVSTVQRTQEAPSGSIRRLGTTFVDGYERAELGGKPRRASHGEADVHHARTHAQEVAGAK